MKYTLLPLLFAFAFNTQAQTTFTYANFEKEVLAFEPIQNESTTEKNFKHAIMVLGETKKATENNPANFNRADYFNLLYVFLSLHESQATLDVAFKKFQEADKDCEYMFAFEKSLKEKQSYAPIREAYLLALANCKGKVIQKKEVFDPKTYAKSNKLNVALVNLLYEVKLNDQKHREDNSAKSADKQKPLDKQNQRIIDSLYKYHQTYLGNTLVGPKLNYVMWSVIQHSNVGMMERYIPILQQAVANSELNETPFKMLLDRYYGLTFGYQFFGTQNGFGFDLADEKVRKEIMEKYGIK